MSEEKTVMQSFATPANLLTFSRLVFMPVVIYGLVTDQHWVTVGAMFLAWITDLLDGRIARLMKQGGSRFGKALDSTVDFALIYCLFIAFYASGRLEHYQFAILYLAMLMIFTLQFFLEGSGREGEVATSRLGKPTGAFQYLYLLFLVVLEIPAVREIEWVTTVHDIYFGIMAVVIALNAIEIVMMLARMGREKAAVEGGPGAAGEKPLEDETP